MARSSSGESVIQRVARILEQFGPHTAELSLTMISRRAQLPIATTHRLVEELVYYGLLQRTDTRSVRLGNRLSEICRDDNARAALHEVCGPYMQDLHAVVGHPVCLGALDGHEVVCLLRFDDTRACGGGESRVPAYASPCGLVLLAHLPRPSRDQMLNTSMDLADAPNIVEPRRIRRVLAEARRTGYVIVPGCSDPDGTSIAVPIRDDSGDVVCALSVTVPADHRTQRVIPALLTTARSISRQLGVPVPA